MRARRRCRSPSEASLAAATCAPLTSEESSMSCTQMATGAGPKDGVCAQNITEITRELTASCHARSLDFFKGLVRKKAAS